MHRVESLQKMLMFFALAYSRPVSSNPKADTNWSYDDTNQWGANSPSCEGYRQSPIHLKTGNSYHSLLPPLRFENYDVPLKGPLTLVNNGHTANMEIPATKNGQRASITGGELIGRYEAIGVHFHWGSPNNKGSEHMIDNQRYAVEMHIVHKNSKYETVEEATHYKDGLAVLGIMFKKVHKPDRYYPGLNKIFNKLSQIIEYQSAAKINGQLTVGQLIGDVNIKNFFTYKGSLTTPPCSEAVTWVVFPDPLPIASSQIEKFYDLMNSNEESMVLNYRPLQPVDGRKVIFRTKPFFTDDPFYIPF